MEGSKRPANIITNLERGEDYELDESFGAPPPPLCEPPPSLKRIGGTSQILLKSKTPSATVPNRNKAESSSRSRSVSPVKSRQTKSSSTFPEKQSTMVMTAVELVKKAVKPESINEIGDEPSYIAVNAALLKRVEEMESETIGLKSAHEEQIATLRRQTDLAVSNEASSKRLASALKENNEKLLQENHIQQKAFDALKFEAASLQSAIDMSKETVNRLNEEKVELVRQADEAVAVAYDLQVSLMS